MKSLIALSLLLICFFTQSFLYFSRPPFIYPIFDNFGVELRNFRTARVYHSKPSLNLKGMNYLRASGSGQFSEKNFGEILKILPVSTEKLVVLDLRQESHGFINGHPISWTDGIYNYGNLHKEKSEIEADEYQRLRLAIQARRIVINPVKEPTKLSVHSVKTERDLIEGLGSIYLRLPVTDHNRPSDEILDQFVEFVKNLPHDQWIHFHCKAGKGRTTTFLTLLDMMRNAAQIDFPDILTRQKWIGGIDLKAVRKVDSERTRAANERLEFVQKFYLYCQQVPTFHIKWSDWIKQQQPILANR